MNELIRPKSQLIFLTGFMGSGKSTVGPILANTLGYEFVDIDRAIEEQTGKPIVTLFETMGEPGFRALEHSTLLQLSQLDGYVISLGGGTIANDENFQLIRRSGIIVYLQLSKQEILHRVQRKEDRPMLKDAQGRPLTPDAMTARVDELLTRREQFYNRADIVVSTDRKRVGFTVDEVVKRLHALPSFKERK
jgi:shikimate kinase